MSKMQIQIEDFANFSTESILSSVTNGKGRARLQFEYNHGEKRASYKVVTAYSKDDMAEEVYTFRNLETAIELFNYEVRKEL